MSNQTNNKALTAEEKYITEKWGENWLACDWHGYDVQSALNEFANQQTEEATTELKEENERLSRENIHLKNYKGPTGRSIEDYELGESRHKNASSAYKAELEKTKQQLSAMVEALDVCNSYPLSEVLRHLCEAADILLNKKDYDGGGWEVLNAALKRGIELMPIVQKAQSTISFEQAEAYRQSKEKGAGG